ncbi:MAG: hypothetical protein A2504_08235 [Bdellovibrionales bacterium RIFOXYD12_FULL_39_22]|nr:MAG: hypothetical protein A2385_01460 [Bdellovibrionales bacterium RIFOXYB1_FULL_39_21]OFZ42887.1 MAG: hypothetical protein A2485_10910 [Bdellovibrionales bacterium RIFOXYC12_FULL_39_17]OFZ47453.1 MAG: hypothetical protein A2404_14380 [Bdellovibrionales bacterium RIFOXYC1_FULL_39_130]OFZ72700.1 MAG: hypothetical protein A2451_07160 [Bdellovibrionales bacterium RIFOXYC2_FULL_39_8]OFZ75541.1 MAG: hypothetical protein A2560_14530 [Bdellovibrionales bacterium RIFOXYD1_FULL_39_84]OFZ93864.1 MAG:
MLTSFSEFKFYQSFRIPVDALDELRFLVKISDGLDNGQYMADAKLLDISVTGLGFATSERISVGVALDISLQFKKYHLDIRGTVVRAFANINNETEIIYGTELEADKQIGHFLEQYVMAFTPNRLRSCLIDAALKERYTRPSEGFEMFSLLLSLFRDITQMGDSKEFLDNMLMEVVRILNAQRASIFLINPDTNELEAVSAMGVDIADFKFDYRLGIAGSVFTTGVALNVDTNTDKTRFNGDFDKQNNFKTNSIICYPISNREDKVVGVIQVLNKKNEDRFTLEDEKTMKVLSLVFSSVFHKYSPMSEKSMVRRFSAPYDRENVIIGKSSFVTELRKTIVKLKDLDLPLLVYGERGVGKSLFAQIVHVEGNRGLNKCDVIECHQKDIAEIERQLFGLGEHASKLIKCQKGTLILEEVEHLPLDLQHRLYQVIKNNSTDIDGIPQANVRIVATTTSDLEQMAISGDFDKELYHFLAQSYVRMDSLRKRTEDIEPLLNYFLRIECQKHGLLLKSFSVRAINKLKEYDWPGNISELQMLIQRVVSYNPKLHVITEVELEGDVAPLFDIDAKKRVFGDINHVSDSNIPLRDRLSIIERELIIAEIKVHLGNKSRAAKALGISREALRKKLMAAEELVGKLDKNVKSKLGEISDFSLDDLDSEDGAAATNKKKAA